MATVGTESADDAASVAEVCVCIAWPFEFADSGSGSATSR